ncbi:MAG TPA: PDZ domain-containing protein [Vicinamibacterales bacterium]|nr:PDZ domain-containing protein [Vicinamibacterales bacterium]
MTLWKSVALSAALVSVASLGAAYAPVAHGQSQAPRATGPRAAEVFARGNGGRLGVSIRDVGTEDANGQSPNVGVIIETVDEHSAAEKAGIKQGDVLVEFDGERVRSVRQFTRLVSETPGGRTVTAAAMRGGSRVSLSITPREGSAHFLQGGEFEALEMFRDLGVTRPTFPQRPAMPGAPAAQVAPLLESLLWRGTNRLGVTVGELSPQLAEYFGTKDGVLVSAVDDNSAASKSGVKAGDVITNVNGQPVDSSSELRRRLARLDAGEEFSLGIVREKKRMTLKGKVEGSVERRRVTRTT